MSFKDLEMLQGINTTKSRRYHDYFRAKRTMRNTSLMAPPEYRMLYFTSIPFVRLGCQVISERIEIDSVRAVDRETKKEDETATKWIQSTLKAWGGSAFVNQAVMTSMEYGRSYLIPTGTDRQDELPGVQVIPGKDMVHEVNPYTGEVVEALRVYGVTASKRVHYTPETTVYLTGSGEGWRVENSVPNPENRIAVFPMMCRGEVNNTFGRPEGKDAFTLQDAACRVATDMAIASAAMAVPQRVLVGAEANDFKRVGPNGQVEKDEDGNDKVMTGQELYMARLLTIADPAAKIAEYSAAQLQNFATAINTITRQTAAVLGVPQSVFGVASDSNPASGDAIRQDDERLIRRAEQLTQGFESAWIGLFEYLLLNYGYGDLEVQIDWIDPRLPNLAARADAVFKLASVVVGNRPLYSWAELRRMLGDGLEAIDRARAELETNEIMDLILQAPGTAASGRPGQVQPEVIAA